MFETYILPIIIFAALGLLAGVLLTVASKVFYVKTDDRIQQISDALPQANCGSCGYPGCGNYAEAIVKDGAPANLCRPGGNETAQKISAILGTEAEEIAPQTAVVLCKGDCEAVQTRFNYGGTQSCKAAKRLYGGAKSCTYGCIGLGDCAKVCDENAIEIINGVAAVTGVCIACGKCVKACPNSIISIKKIANRIDAKCSSKDNGKNTRLACKNGCIGCKMCEKKCQHDAIKVVDFHAVIDYDKCVSCGDCAAACPMKVITDCEDTK